MAGIGLVLNTAKDALLTQQYAMDVVSHNIANVSTEGYSRQTPNIEAKMPGPYGGLIFGRGVELQKIQRQLDTFVETRLRERESDLSAMSEKETYLTVLEGVFDENSGRSISAQFDAFWNAWQDLSNNPSGSAERTIVYESGAHLAQSFQDIRNDLDRFEQELNLSLEAGTEKINQLTSQVATLNEQIISMEINADANDLRDQRDTLIRNLSEHLDIKVFEDGRGHLTVTTGKGYTLVSKTDHYELSFESGEVRWEGSSGSVDITDMITEGKLGGWLEVRDAFLPKYRSELDELAESVIWNVNEVHSQGVGLEGMTSVTGTYAVEETDQPFGDPGGTGAGLDFVEGLHMGSFTGDVDFSGGQTLAANMDLEFYEGGNSETVSFATGTDLGGIVVGINSALSAAGMEVSASITNGDSGEEYLTLSHNRAASGASFGLGISTANDELGLNQSFHIWTRDESAPDPVPIDNEISLNADTTLDELVTEIQSIAGLSASAANGKLSITAVGAHTFAFSDDTSGILAALGINTFFDGTNARDITMNETLNTHKEYMAAGRVDPDTGEIAVGDNTNALAVADLSQQKVAMDRFTYDSPETPASSSKDTFQGYYAHLVGSVGIKSESVQREQEYAEVVVNQLTQKRNDLSAVSLDEEMTNLIKYQHAYSAAAKLVSTADEMLQTLLQTR
jgi:flagellar hook-associated protein FlgK